ncbi:unnamed protein product [Ambrosiozyma monospora]|uniref:Unnamed protein product n=1 Tax=Ambrosiozyma monospora TaxID=43982 RepID=A0A9W7DP14_AMBMO|nr:unnamed protein product [Ambrosiozyma monospora]
MDDLFGVFSEAPSDVSKLTEQHPTETNDNNKRPASPSSTKENEANKKAKVSSDKPDSSSSKTPTTKKDKKKANAAKTAAAPIVADSLEIEASREVKASQGLISSSSNNGDEKMNLKHQIRHQVAVPPHWNYTPISQHKRQVEARHYKFTLDPFQDTAISCIDRQESVLVSAHTSAVTKSSENYKPISMMLV